MGHAFSVNTIRGFEIRAREALEVAEEQTPSGSPLSAAQGGEPSIFILIFNSTLPVQPRNGNQFRAR